MRSSFRTLHDWSRFAICALFQKRLEPRVIAQRVPHRIELQQAEPWNYHVGMRAGIGGNWNLAVKGGFGKRKSVLTNLEYRFGKR